MKVLNIRAIVAHKLGRIARRTRKPRMLAGTAILAGGMLFCGSANAVDVLTEDFEGLTLTTNTPPGPDYTDAIPGWTRDNSGMAQPSSNLAYDGGTAMDIAGWVTEQGAQLGRNGAPGGPYLTGDNALIFDGDAWDDFVPESAPLGFNSFWMTNVDLTGFDRNTAEVAFDYEFASYDSQRALAEVSFDGGTSWETILDLDSDIIGNSVLSGASVSFSAGADFTPTSDSLTFRIGLVDTDNDWWFAVDNVVISAVPEPAGAGLLGLGLFGLAAARRRRG